MRVIPGLLLLSSLAPTGCVEQAYKDSIAQFPPPTTETSSSTGESDTPTTSGSAVQSATGSPESTGATEPLATDDGPTDPPPFIKEFYADPNPQTQAGVARLQLITSDDVVKATLQHDVDPPQTLTPAEFIDIPIPAAFTAADNDSHKYTVIVEDAGGQKDDATLEFTVLLPASGAPKCLFEDKDLGAKASEVTALLYLADAIVAVGSRDIGDGEELAVWKLGAEDCQPLPGWPKTLSAWTGKKALTDHPSSGAALAVDERGALLVGGNLDIDGKPQSYVAALTPDGGRLWEQEGLVGDELTGLAAATGQFSDRVYVVGSRRTSQIPIRTDAAMWAYQILANVPFVPPATLLRAPFVAKEQPDDDNVWNEVARAVTVQPATGYGVVVGERQYFDGKQATAYERGFTVRIDALGNIVGAPWTSTAPAFLRDGLVAIARCGAGLVAGGWTLDDLNAGAQPQSMLLWLADDGTGAQVRHEADLNQTHTFGVACDPVGKIVSAATQSLVDDDAQVFAVTDANSPRIAYEAGFKADDGARAASCDEWGFCAWGGYRTSNGVSYAVVRAHHP